MSYILHIDTSGSEGRIAVAQNGTLLASETTDDTRNQAAAINNMIEATLATAGIKAGQLSAIAVCGGPGSYTGLRIGMATAKGLCYALDIPMMADNKLTLLAGNKQRTHQEKYSCYTALLQARENEYFVTVLDAEGKVILAPQHKLARDLGPLQAQSYLVTDVIGIGELVVNDTDVDTHVSIDMNHWCEIAFQAFSRQEFVNIATIAPFYLKEVYTHK